MNGDELTKELISLLVTLAFAAAVNSYFKGRSYPPELAYQTFWPRFWAPTIDSVVLWPLVTLVPMIWLGVSPRTYPFIAMMIFTTFVQFAYSIYFHGRYGATIGKMRCGVKVVDVRTEMPITLRQAFLRDSVPLVLLMGLAIYTGAITSGMAHGSGPPLRMVVLLPMIALAWFGLEVLTMLTNEKRRALHDFIAGTVVIRTNLIGNDRPRRFSHLRIAPEP